MADNSAQKNSPSFRLAALDPDFLLGDSMRGVRLQIEYEKAEERLRAWTVRSTVVVFGSARARPAAGGIHGRLADLGCGALASRAKHGPPRPEGGVATKTAVKLLRAGAQDVVTEL